MKNKTMSWEDMLNFLEFCGFKQIDVNSMGNLIFEKNGLEFEIAEI